MQVPINTAASRSFRRASRRRVVALIPAHNEAARIADTLARLSGQSRPPDVTIVIADNCTDRTVDIVRDLGVEVFETQGNAHKRAGALNQAVALLLPDLRDHDVVLVQDPGSVMDREFVQEGLISLAAEEPQASAEAPVRGPSWPPERPRRRRLLHQLQSHDHGQYPLKARGFRGQTLVEAGAASMFRAGTLRGISEARLRETLPAGDGEGGVFDPSAPEGELSWP